MSAIGDAASLRDELLRQFSQLPAAKQVQLVQYATTLNSSLPEGVTGRELLKLSGTWDAEAAAELAAAIEQGCEQVDQHGW